MFVEKHYSEKVIGFGLRLSPLLYLLPPPLEDIDKLHSFKRTV